MPLLKEKLKEYERLVNTIIRITVEAYGTDIIYDIKFNTYGFPHLVGLGKYSSIDALSKYSNRKLTAKAITKRIQKDKITYDILKNTKLWEEHVYGDKYKERIDTFSFNRIIDIIQNDVVIYFKKSLLGTDFDADLLIYDKILDKYYHFSVFNEDLDAKPVLCKASSYFIDDRDIYINGQTTATVKSLQVIDQSTNQVIVEKESVMDNIS